MSVYTKFWGYKEALDFAFERMDLGPHWKDKEGAMARAIELRDLAIDDAIAHCKSTGRRLEDVLGLPR